MAMYNGAPAQNAGVVLPVRFLLVKYLETAFIGVRRKEKNS
jgi:hypothetical protein